MWSCGESLLLDLLVTAAVPVGPTETSAQAVVLER